MKLVASIRKAGTPLFDNQHRFCFDEIAGFKAIVVHSAPEPACIKCNGVPPRRLRFIHQYRHLAPEHVVDDKPH